MRQKERTKIVITVLVLAGFLLLLKFTWIQKQKNAEMQVAIYVNGAPVTVREFRQRMEYDYRALTIDHFTKKWGGESDGEFWDTEFDGMTPREYLTEKTIEACTLIKIQTLEMQKRDILKDISYESFLRDMERENQRRKELVERGGIIYGPQQYSENEYFIYVFSNLQKELKEQLAKELGWNEADKLQAYYLENRDTYFKYSDQIEVLKIVFAYDKDTKEEIYAQLEEIRQIASDWQKFEKAGSEVGIVERQLFTEESARSDSRYYEPLKLAAMELEPGSVSQVIDDGERLALIYCVSREEGEYIPFNTVIDQVSSLHSDECYEKWLMERYGEADIVVKQVKAITDEAE